MPKVWAEDAVRRAKAHIPEDVAFATKPAMAREMIARLLDEDIPCRFVLADAVYGSDRQFRRMLEMRKQPYVLAVRSTHMVRFFQDEMLIQTDPATLFAALDADMWHRCAAGEGAKGPRLYHWARLPLGTARENGFERWMLARRSRHDPEAVAYYTNRLNH